MQKPCGTEVTLCGPLWAVPRVWPPHLSTVRENTVLPAITADLQGGYSDSQQDVFCFCFFFKILSKLTRVFL